MNTFKPGARVTVAGLYFFEGEPPTKTTLTGGSQGAGCFVTAIDHSRQIQNLSAGGIFPDLGDPSGQWRLIKADNLG